MKAVILSAGQGKRLLPLTADCPKCILPVRGRTLIEWQIDELAKCGIDEINISLWAASADVYKKLHPKQTRGTFHNITAMIDRFVEFKQEFGVDYPKLVMYNVISHYNCNEILQMVEYAFQHRLDAIHFEPVEVINGKTDRLGLDAEDKQVLEETLNAFPDHFAKIEEIYRHQLRIENFKIFSSRIKSSTNDDYDAAILKDMNANKQEEYTLKEVISKLK